LTLLALDTEAVDASAVKANTVDARALAVDKGLVYLREAGAEVADAEVVDV